MKRSKSRSREEWSAIVSAFEQSGLNQVQFSQKLNLTLASVRHWVSRIRKEKRQLKKSPDVRFVEVVSKNPNASEQNAILELPGGIVLKTLAVPPPEYLAELSVCYQRRNKC